MPDIAMCQNETCTASSDCYRHNDSGTRPLVWQSYVDFKPNKDGVCEDFWMLKKEGTVSNGDL